jgi:RHS repeat-associated protein
VVTDENGRAREQTRYLPFGGKRGKGAGIGVSDYLFTDQELDKESGLYNYDARLYDPIIGRFASADSVVPNAFYPQAFDRYAYTLNNPLKYKDPNGHEPISITIASYASYAMGTALVIGIMHYAIPIAEDIGTWIGEKLANRSSTTIGDTSPTIHDGRQGKHVPGHNNFDPDLNRSELTHSDPQGLLDDFAGTGERVGNTEYVDFGQHIGYDVDPVTGKKTPTNRGKIHYDEQGKAHIVPTAPEAPSDAEEEQEEQEDNMEKDS